jgi:hypothetical protein
MRYPLVFSAIFLLIRAPLTAQEEPQICAPKADFAALGGRVTDVKTKLPLQFAKVTLVWQQTGDRRARTKDINADQEGRWAFCETPPGTRIFLRASFMDQEVRGETVELEPGATKHVNVEIASPSSRITGKITDAEGGKPISDAAVSIGGGRLMGTSRNDGTFSLGEVPPGRYQLEIRHIAYGPRTDSLTVELGASTNVVAKLATSAIKLEPIAVEVRSLLLEMSGFYDRMARGHGSYVQYKDIERLHPLIPSDILRAQPGLRLERRRTQPGYTVYSRAGCPVRYFINGAKVGADFQIDDIPVDWIDALEIYRGAASLPAEFQMHSSDVNAQCGIIVIWTRNRN